MSISPESHSPERLLSAERSEIAVVTATRLGLLPGHLCLPVCGCLSLVRTPRKKEEEEEGGRIRKLQRVFFFTGEEEKKKLAAWYVGSVRIYTIA